jgi:hypothetical protein
MPTLMKRPLNGEVFANFYRNYSYISKPISSGASKGDSRQKCVSTNTTQPHSNRIAPFAQTQNLNIISTAAKTLELKHSELRHHPN